MVPLFYSSQMYDAIWECFISPVLDSYRCCLSVWLWRQILHCPLQFICSKELLPVSLNFLGVSESPGNHGDVTSIFMYVRARERVAWFVRTSSWAINIPLDWLLRVHPNKRQGSSLWATWAITSGRAPPELLAPWHGLLGCPRPHRLLVPVFPAEQALPHPGSSSRSLMNRKMQNEVHDE